MAANSLTGLRFATVPMAIAVQHLFEVLASIRVIELSDGFGRTCADYAPAAVSAFGAKVDHPVGGLDDFEVMLDDDD